MNPGRVILGEQMSIPATPSNRSPNREYEGELGLVLHKEIRP